MKAYIVYDSDGKVLVTRFGDESEREVFGKVFEIPDNVMNVEKIDLKDKENPKAIYAYYPESDIGVAVSEERERREKAERKINEYKTALNMVIPTLDDEMVEKVFLVSPESYQEWKAGVSYAENDKVRYRSALYNVLQPHKAQKEWEPGKTPSLYVEAFKNDSGELQAWRKPTGSHDAYMIGDRVHHNKIVWESLVDSNVWEPGEFGSATLWKKIENE